MHYGVRTMVCAMCLSVCVRLRPQAMRGTPCYMAPELFADGATHSTASDLWSLGCVLYECSMGRPPFMNSSFNQLVQEILTTEPQPIPGVPGANRHVLGCTALG